MDDATIVNTARQIWGLNGGSKAGLAKRAAKLAKIAAKASAKAEKKGTKSAVYAAEKANAKADAAAQKVAIADKKSEIATGSTTGATKEVDVAEMVATVGSVVLNLVPQVRAVKAVKAAFDIAQATVKALATVDTIKQLANSGSKAKKSATNQSSSGSANPPQNPKNNPKVPKDKDKDKPSPSGVIPTKEMQNTCWEKLKQSGEWKHDKGHNKPTLKNEKTGQFLQKSIEKWELEAFDKQEKHIGTMRPNEPGIIKTEFAVRGRKMGK